MPSAFGDLWAHAKRILKIGNVGVEQAVSFLRAREPKPSHLLGLRALTACRLHDGQAACGRSARASCT